ncbi:MAG: hypothetical protein IJ583_07255 [Firmicutes bacterium]|nr:hypothetical protein [Bacillota bacterium]
MNMDLNLNTSGNLSNAAVKMASTLNAKKKGSSNSSFDKMKQSSAKKIASNFSPVLELIKLATATSESQVKNIIRNLDRKIGTLKQAGGYEATIKKMKKIVKKGNEKIEKLEKEEEIKKTAKKAEEEKRIKESREMKKALENRKLRRKSKEINDIKNADSVTAIDGEDSALSSPSEIELSLFGQDFSVSADASSDISMIDLEL